MFPKKRYTVYSPRTYGELRPAGSRLGIDTRVRGRVLRRTSILLFVLTVVALTMAPLSSTAVGTDSSALRNAVGVNGIMAHQTAFQSIATANGGNRAAGTPGYDASLAYVKAKLDATGYYDVVVQPFLFDTFREVATPVFQRISPSPRAFVANEDFITMDYSDTGDVTGTLVATNDIVVPPGAQASTSSSGCEASDFTPASATQLQVALIQRGTCDFRVKAENAQAAGYDAAIIFNEGQPGRQETLAGTLSADDTSTIPVIGTSFAIGEELYNQVRAGTVTVRVATTVEIRRDVPTANLLATTKTGRTDRQVVVGAHLDSVTEGAGINDNGSGSAQNLEIALQMAKLNLRPVNQVRFAWWGAEESGLIGSQFYVDSLTARELKGTAVNLNFDMVGSPNFVRFVYDGDASDTDSLGSTGSGVVEQVFLELLRLAGARVRADRVRRPLGLRRLHQRRDPGRWSVHGSRGDQDRGAGGDLRRHGRSRVRPVLPRGLRRHRQSVDHGTGSDVRRRCSCHAGLRPDHVRCAGHGQGQGKGSVRGRVPRLAPQEVASPKRLRGEGSAHAGPSSLRLSRLRRCQAAVVGRSSSSVFSERPRCSRRRTATSAPRSTTRSASRPSTRSG